MQVDDYELAEETPTKKPDVAPVAPQPASPEVVDSQLPNTKLSMSADRRTAEWVTALSPVMESDEGALDQANLHNSTEQDADAAVSSNPGGLCPRQSSQTAGRLQDNIDSCLVLSLAQACLMSMTFSSSCCRSCISCIRNSLQSVNAALQADLLLGWPAQSACALIVCSCLFQHRSSELNQQWLNSAIPSAKTKWLPSHHMQSCKTAYCYTSRHIHCRLFPRYKH